METLKDHEEWMEKTYTWPRAQMKWVTWNCQNNVHLAKIPNDQFDSYVYPQEPTRVFFKVSIK